MRLACLSDIHGNLRALDACLADLREQGGADAIVGVGDYCMDGPRPEAVVDRLRELGATCVRGNTDRSIVDAPPAAPGEDPEDERERRAIVWQRERLGEDRIAWLGALPFAERFAPTATADPADALLVVHANPKSDDEHLWPDADDALLERVTSDVAERTIAFGHLHLPYVRMWRERLFVNVASAGLPKDGDPRAGYAILTARAGGWQVRHRRVAFDVERVVREIESSGMPGARKRVNVLRRHRYRELDERNP
ncbi:MAG: metallophosphoesterase family protein [Vulcanimicrobiaceae bacterium]